LAYQWYRNSVAVSGATATTYTLVAADDLTQITVKVTGSKSGYGDEITTSAGFQVGLQFVNHNAPTIKGNNWVGQTLTATIGLWDSGATLTHQWYRNGVAISGATAHTYKLVTADVGKKISISTSGTKTGYVAKTSTSAETATILTGKPFAKTPTPTISGNARVGATLTAKAGSWSPVPTKYYYQWLRAGVAIAGATKSTYKLTAADKGFNISVSVKVARSGYATTAKKSATTISIK
jgi:hypothetical protein